MYRTLLIHIATAATLTAGPYPGAAGTAGSDAISKDDSRIIRWASGHIDYVIGGDVSTTWRTPVKAYGPATTNTGDIVCLGDDGRITLYFPHPVFDGPGPDFAVFENSFSDTFLELGFVEVSSDGENFFRFANASLTTSPVGGFGSVDPTNLSGLAGKYRGGFGTPFDLDDLPSNPLLDKQRVCFIRIVDIKGNGTAKDSSNRSIYDPHPTTGSAGFDLDAIGVIHENNGDFAITQGGFVAESFKLTWQSNPGNTYRIESGTKLDDWTQVQTLAGSENRGLTELSLPFVSDPKRFWRVVRIED